MTILRPFHELQLAPDTPRADVFKRGAELRVDYPDPTRDKAIWVAVEQLTTKSTDRLRHELFEVPGSRYPLQQRAWNRFQKAHKRNPIDVTAMLANERPPVLADVDLAEVLRIAFRGWLDAPGPELGPALEQAPVDIDWDAGALEIVDVLFT